MALNTELHDPGPLRPVLEWVDSRFGPFYELAGVRFAPPDPAWWLYVCSLARAPVGMWYVPEPAAAGGAAVEGEVALRRTLGEAVERYSGLNADFDEHLVQMVAREGGLAERFPRCAPDEKCPPSFRGLENVNEPIVHVAVENLADGKETHIPAAYVLLDYWPEPPEPPVAVPISTGMAFHTDRLSALWAGLCESAERDAFMLTWWARRQVPEIVCEGIQLPGPLFERVDRLRRAGLTPHLYDITTNFRVPAVTCFLTGEQYPYLSAGAACAADPLQACTKAIDEAVYVRTPSRMPGVKKEVPSRKDFDWVQQLEDHRSLYAGWESPPGVEFLMNPKNKRIPYMEFAGRAWWKTPNTMDEFKSFAQRLQREEDLTVLWTDMSVPELKHFGSVVKVIVPEMIPLSASHNVRWLGTPRMLEAAGVRKAKASHFNPYPHPFP